MRHWLCCGSSISNIGSIGSNNSGSNSSGSSAVATATAVAVQPWQPQCSLTHGGITGPTKLAMLLSERSSASGLPTCATRTPSKDTAEMPVEPAVTLPVARGRSSQDGVDTAWTCSTELNFIPTRQQADASKCIEVGPPAPSPPPQPMVQIRRSNAPE